MKNKKLFIETVSILVKAYINETLFHGNCQCCAVGNIIVGRGELHYKPYHIGGIVSCEKDNQVHLMNWGGAGDVGGYGDGFSDEICTGYSSLEIVKIESAFEKVNDDEGGYNGLMNVVDCLIELHKGTDGQKKEAKEMFVKVEANG